MSKWVVGRYIADSELVQFGASRLGEQLCVCVCVFMGPPVLNPSDLILFCARG